MTDKCRCVVFDLDDTLYLERDYVRSGLAAVGEYVRDTFDLQGFQDLAWEAFKSGARGDIFDQALARSGLERTDELIRDLVRQYRTHPPRIALQADAEVCLTKLQGDFKLGLVSDGPIESQRAKIEALGLDAWIQESVLTAELGPEFAKPHPRAFREIEQTFGIGGSECMYVADNPAKDFDGPKSLGWRTVRIRRPGGLYSIEDSGQNVDSEFSHLCIDELVDPSVSNRGRY